MYITVTVNSSDLRWGVFFFFLTFFFPINHKVIVRSLDLSSCWEQTFKHRASLVFCRTYKPKRDYGFVIVVGGFKASGLKTGPVSPPTILLSSKEPEWAEGQKAAFSGAGWLLYARGPQWHLEPCRGSVRQLPLLLGHQTVTDTILVLYFQEETASVWCLSETCLFLKVTKTKAL